MALIVYGVCNTVNGKVYVGITGQSLRRRWTEHRYNARRGSKSALHAAIRKYGPDAFEIMVLDRAETHEELCTLEQHWIQRVGSLAPQGYNLTSGGDGRVGPLPEKDANRLRTAFLGRSHSEETKAKISEGNRGLKRSDETRRRISEAARRRASTTEGRAHLSRLGKMCHELGMHKGSTRSPETRRKISEAMRRQK